MEFTDQEWSTLQDMLQYYRESQEEIYDYPDDPATLFTKTQRRLFTRFDVISIKKEQSS